MRAHLAALGCLFVPIVNAGSDQTVNMAANVNVITHAEPAGNGDSTSNLLDGKEFFVCNSLIEGMDGHYVLYEDATAGADQGAPVFARGDDEDENYRPGMAITIAGDKSHEHDFRLMRRNGFWMFVDVAPWPPTTLFRCDPTKTDVSGVDVRDACGMNLAAPPLLGYSPVESRHKTTHLALRQDGCEENAAPLERAGIQTNLSDRKDEL